MAHHPFARIEPSALDLVAQEIAAKTRALLAQDAETPARLAERPALRLEEASQLIGVSRQFLARFIHSGELPTVNLGSTLRMILREDLDAWLRARRAYADPTDTRHEEVAS